MVISYLLVGIICKEVPSLLWVGTILGAEVSVDFSVIWGDEFEAETETVWDKWMENTEQRMW